MPLAFFRTNLRVYPGSPDHAILALRNHREFGSLLSESLSEGKSSLRRPSRWATLFRKSHAVPSAPPLNPDSSSEKGLVSMSLTDASTSSTHPFGGIMVNQDVTISGEEQQYGPEIELRELGVRSEAGIADTEQLTMADRLMSITTSFRDPHARGVGRDAYGRR